LTALAAMVSATVLMGGLAGAQDEMPIQKPTEQHKKLRADVGTWEATIKTFAGPDGAATESKGTEINRMMPGGLWLVSDFRGEFAGMPFRGHGVTGYDVHKKKYVGTWVDSMSSSVMVIEGDYDADGKVLVMEGTTPNPADGSPIPVRLVSTSTGDDTRVFTMNMKMGDEYVKMMEMTYRKTAGPPEAAKKKADRADN
jgi:hypothetical protein